MHSALAAPRTDLCKMWYPPCLYEMRWLCVGCAEVRSQKCVFCIRYPSDSHVFEMVLHRLRRGQTALCTSLTMVILSLWLTQKCVHNTPETLSGQASAAPRTGLISENWTNPNTKNKVRINQCRPCRRLNSILLRLIEKQFVDQRLAVPRSDLSKKNKNSNNMQGRRVKVGSGANLGTVLDWQIDNELKRGG